MSRAPRPIAAVRSPATAAVALLLAVAALSAQEARTAVVPDSARVGDVVHVAVRVVLSPGQRAAWPDTLELPAGGDVENAERVHETVDTLADGRLQATAVYGVTPWRTGEQALGTLRFAVVGGEESPEARAMELPSLRVLSVLPADTAGIQPRPAKGVLGRAWSWWPILLIALGVLLLALLLAWWIRRRRRRLGVPLAVTAPGPRERALAELDAARAERLIERGEMKALYIRIGAAVRHFTAALEPAWGEELTTTEILARVRDAGTDREDARALEAVLRSADQVKFARRRPDAAAAEREWGEARAWVAGFRAPPASPPEEAAA